MKKYLNQKYLEDLTTYLKIVSQKRGIERDKNYPDESMHLDFYFKHSKEDLQKYVTDYLINNDINNDYDFLYFMNTLIKYMTMGFDSNTLINMKDEKELPLKFSLINNSVYISSCNDKDFVKAKIYRINNIAIDVILSELERSISYTNKGELYSKIENKLNKTSTLLSLPVIDITDVITYETSKGILSYSLNEDYSLSEEKNGVLVKDNSLIIRDINSYKLESNINNIIFDLRDYNDIDIDKYRLLLNSFNNSNYNFYTLVDRHTNNNCLSLIMDMKKMGSQIIGEEIGTSINCFGLNDLSYVLPNTNLECNFSKAYLNYLDNTYIYTKEDLYDKPDNYYKSKSLLLDKELDISEEEYLNSNEDIMIEKALEYINEQQKKKVY